MGQQGHVIKNHMKNLAPLSTLSTLLLTFIEGINLLNDCQFGQYGLGILVYFCFYVYRTVDE